MCRVTLTNELLTLAVVQVVVRENQIETTRGQSVSGRCQTRNNGDSVRCQELPYDLLCKNRVVLKVKNVHGCLY